MKGMYCLITCTYIQTYSYDDDDDNNDNNNN